jgi:hypothetical protein
MPTTLESNGAAGLSEAPASGKPRRIKALKLALPLLGIALALGAAELVRRKRLVERQLLARRIIVEQTGQFLSSPDILRLAASQPEISRGNVQLAACLLGVGLCTATDPNDQVAFGLRSRMDPDAHLLVGTDGNPAFYSMNGAPNCDAGGDPACPGWAVKAWFWAECDGSATSCQGAREIHVRYQVYPAPRLSHLPASPTTEVLQSDPYAYATTVTVPRL